MKKIYITIVLALLIVTTYAQFPYLEWAYSTGGTRDDLTYAICTDNNGYVYTAGSFQDSVDFNPDTGTLILDARVYYLSGFVQKTDVSGNVIWAKSIDGLSNATSVVTDPQGNVYVAGIFVDSTDFDPGAGSVTLSSQEEDLYVLKLNSVGDFIWVKTIGKSGNMLKGLMELAVDDQSNIYVTGVFRDTMDFDPGVGDSILVSEGYEDIFLLKLDSSGNFVWVNRLGGKSAERVEDIYIDVQNNILLTGGFLDSVDFDPGLTSSYLTSNGSNDIFIQKLSPAGDLVWAKSIGGHSGDVAWAVTGDDSGNVFLGGGFKYTVDFDPGPDTLELVSYNGSIDAFVEKLDSNGNFIWVRTFGGAYSDLINDLEVDDEGGVYSAGWFMDDSIDFDPGLGQVFKVAQGDDFFIHKLDAGGLFKWVKVINAHIGGNKYAQIALDTSNNVYVTGATQGTMDIDPGPNEILLSSNHSFDFFLAKFFQCIPGTPPIPDVGNLPVLIHQCPKNTLPVPNASHSCATVIPGVGNISTPLTTPDTLLMDWAYDDGNGYVFTQQQTVIILDTVSPNVDLMILADVVGECGIDSVLVPTVMDSCAGMITAITTQIFPLTTSGTTEVVWEFNDGNGNTSFVSQNLIVIPIDDSVQVRGDTLLAVAEGYSYQWFKCDDQIMTGDTNRYFIPKESGSYKVEISNGNCSVISDCAEMVLLNNNRELEKKIRVWPNPVGDFLYVECEDVQMHQVDLELKDVTGRVLFQSSMDRKKMVVGMEGFAQGLYFISITDQSRTTVKKVLKR